VKPKEYDREKAVCKNLNVDFSGQTREIRDERHFRRGESSYEKRLSKAGKRSVGLKE